MISLCRVILRVSFDAFLCNINANEVVEKKMLFQCSIAYLQTPGTQPAFVELVAGKKSIGRYSGSFLIQESWVINAGN